jgi:hypothetical protein
MRRILPLVLTLLSFQLYAADYYWVGGSGNWSDLNHWHLGSSGGPIPSIVPSAADNVFFDANSGFTSASKTVTLNANGACNNMTWGSVANSPLFVTAASTITVQVSGNLVLNPTTTYQSIFAFKGATAATLTTNGTVLGQFGIEVDKPGSSLTVTDSLIVPSAVTTAGTNGFTFTAGTFDITGKKMTVYSFISDNNNVRVLEMANANLTTNSGTSSSYHYTGTGKTLNSSGSTLYTGGLSVDGGAYSRVTATTAAGPNTIIINNTTFNVLTFSPVGGAIYSDITNGNTVDTLVYNGQGSIGSNNTIGSVRFAGIGSLDGTGNVIGSITCLNNFAVSGNYTNTVDSLILTPNRLAQFRGTFNINEYLYVAGAPCNAFTEISGDSTLGTVNFAAGAVADINNVILTGVKATGSITPIAVDGVDGGGNAGFTITEPAGSGTTLYWVGGAGDWNNQSHWSTTSGGTGGACVPFKKDNVVFDGNSGLAGQTVTTSSTSFCKDINWVTGVGTTTFLESAASSFQVYGSATLQPSVTMNALFEFVDSSTATLTTNGGGTSNFSFYVMKTGSGSLTLMDNWSCPASGSITFVSGNLNMSGRTLSFLIFNSNSNSTRNLDISNATITANLRWIYLGANKSMVSTGSHITSHAKFQSSSPGSNYPWVDLTEIYAESSSDFSIISTTFGQLTFTSTSATSNARISNGNTIRRLEYKGSGFIGAAGNNNIDSLILAGSRNYTFAGTNSIIKYFKAVATTCSGLTEMRGPGILGFGNTAVIDINNIYMQNMTATGIMTPIALNGANAGGNSGWTINSAAGSPRYWIGGSGDWNDQNHWSATSGGAGGACVPTVYDDIYFNAASGFTPVSKTVTVNNGNAYCRNIDWTGSANSPIWSKSASWNIEAWGDSIRIIPTATFNVSALTLKGNNTTYLIGGAPLGNFDIAVDKTGGSLTLVNNYSNTQTDFILYNGAFNAPGLTLDVASIDNGAFNNTSAINVSNATITANLWRYSGSAAAHTLNAANSTITTPTFTATGLTYNNVNVTGILSTNATLSNATINNLIFTNASTSSTVGINGVSNTIATLEYKGSGGVYGTGNTINTLTFFPGKTYTFTAGTTTNITGDWFASGTPCSLTEIVSSSASANATINKTGGAPEFDYIRVRRITAAGSTPFIGFSHTIDQGNNTNWSIAPYNGAAPILGLGVDTAIYATDFPYVLNTDGFFGSPSSQYTWNNGSTADTLIAPDTGTYSVTVTFPDGCTISDNIHLILAAPLPVTLTSFTADVQQCQARLNWAVTDAVNFKQFVVEKSEDGRSFEKIGSVAYAKNVNEYSYTDGSIGKGTAYYRLKLADQDGKYKYSNIESVHADCEHAQVKVYPTLTEGVVYIDLPSGYEQAKIEVYNALGQLLKLPDTGNVNHSGMHSIQLQGQAQGQYLLKVSNGNNVQTFKLMYGL